MNELISQIFEVFNYKNIGDDRTKLFQSETMHDFWLIYDAEPKVFTHEYQAELLSSCKRLCDVPSLDKNLNLLCLWSVEEINRKVLSQLHSLEEDVYFFKKHVLYYTANELTLLETELERASIRNILLSYPLDTEVFNRYKSGVNGGSWESLLYRLCIKLTFLPIRSKEVKSIISLNDEHVEKLSGVPRLKALDDIVQNLTDTALQLPSEEFFELISSAMEGKS